MVRREEREGGRCSVLWSTPEGWAACHCGSLISKTEKRPMGRGGEGTFRTLRLEAAVMEMKTGGEVGREAVEIYAPGM